MFIGLDITTATSFAATEEVEFVIILANHPFSVNESYITLQMARYFHHTMKGASQVIVHLKYGLKCCGMFGHLFPRWSPSFYLIPVVLCLTSWCSSRQAYIRY